MTPAFMGCPTTCRLMRRNRERPARRELEDMDTRLTGHLDGCEHKSEDESLMVADFENTAKKTFNY
ncbi:Hypothetical predicted protein [Xyrichtys novacula]|uniref:Uncharacterized protein n=1 Tax=Xyrichtys novacula TaxID=13765 RepID=A0AAV1EMQ2_XYRNO|nr:Hypothetical predicted protein [Xyrichtys novacula]